MVVSQFYQNYVKHKDSTMQFTTDRIEKHHSVFRCLMMSLLVTACLMIVITAFVPNEIGISYAQGPQDNLKNNSDQKPITASNADSSDSSKEKVNISLASVEFAPLTNSVNNQLKININYKTNDPSLINSPMAGTMKVYDSDNHVIKTSKITNGYILGQSGPMQFATSFTDKTIDNVKADVYMTDTSGNKVSNVLTAEASLTN